MQKLLITAVLISSLFLSGCTTLSGLTTIAGLAAAGYGIYEASKK